MLSSYKVQNQWLLQNCYAYSQLRPDWLKDKACKVGLSSCPDLEALAPYLHVDDHILDVGVGYGRALKYLNEHGFKNIEGVDYADQFLGEATKVDSNITLHKGDFLNCLFDHRYEAVLMLWAFIMEFDRSTQLQLIKKALRVLNPKGFLVIEIIDNSIPDECQKDGDGVIQLDMDGHPFNGVITSVEDVKSLLSNANASLTHLFSYQTDTDSTRTLIIATPT